jgi:hypothetical protein
MQATRRKAWMREDGSRSERTLTHVRVLSQQAAVYFENDLFYEGGK